MKIGIAGAGIMGKLLALYLLNEGWDVTLFDKSESNNCSMTAAGLLTPVSELEKNDMIICQLGIEAIEQHWPKILAQLQPEKIYFKQRGTLVVSHPRDNLELLHFIQLIGNKHASNAPWVQLNQEEISQLEPEIVSFYHGYYFPIEGQLDNQTLLKILGKYLEKRLSFFRNCDIHDIKPHKITLKEKSYTFDLVFDCRGLGAKSIFHDLRPVRGEIIWLHAPDVTITRPLRLIHPRYRLYIVPRPSQIYLVGASEIESEDLSPICVRTTLELLTAAYSIHRGFAEARIIQTHTHCRPTLANNLPKIKYSKGLIAANGLYRHGFLIAPTLAKDIIRILQKGISFVHYPELWEMQA